MKKIHCRGFCKPLALCMVLSLALSSCIKEAPASSLGVGDKVPAFTVTDNHGITITQASLPVVIVFFNTSCRDCQHELPVVQRAYESYSDSQITFVCIAREESQASISAFWAANAMTVPFSPQADRKVYHKFASQGIPRIFVVNSSGIIVAAFDDSNMPSEQTLVAAINQVK